MLLRKFIEWCKSATKYTEEYLDEAEDECNGGTGRDYHPSDPRWEEAWGENKK